MHDDGDVGRAGHSEAGRSQRTGVDGAEFLAGREFRLLDDPVRGVTGSLDEMVHGVGGVFDGLDDGGDGVV
jgi:hypothetical protein